MGGDAALRPVAIDDHRLRRHRNLLAPYSGKSLILRIVAPPSYVDRFLCVAATTRMPSTVKTGTPTNYQSNVALTTVVVRRQRVRQFQPLGLLATAENNFVIPHKALSVSILFN